MVEDVRRGSTVALSCRRIFLAAGSMTDSPPPPLQGCSSQGLCAVPI